jgi:hypothetical protein
MSPFSSVPRRIAADAYEARVEDAILKADDLFDLDGETFFRCRDGRIETAGWGGE